MSTQTVPPALISDQHKKIYYIDHLRVIITILVILHHTFITYGAPGGWYFSQKTTSPGALIPMTMFVSINQSFFMGFFFFLSAYFIPSSYQKKGKALFVRDRLLRLGLPLIFYSFILSPILIYLVYHFGEGNNATFIQFLRGFSDWIDFGVLWFVLALLLFTLLYVLWRSVNQDQAAKQVAMPSAGKIILCAAGVGVASFFVRTIFPVGVVLKPLGFQLGHFCQYVTLFITGLVAASNNWLKTIPFQTGKRLARFVFILLLLFPGFYFIKIKTGMPIEWFSGGMHWQSLLYALWEQVVGFSIITVLICYGKQFWNKPVVLFNRLSRYSFAVYIFHPLVLISLSLLLRNWGADPALKLVVVAPVAVPGSFLLATLMVRLPAFKKIR